MKQTDKKRRSEITETTRDFAGLEVSLLTGSRRKQALSNRLELRVMDARTDTVQRLTLRQARALQRFLEQALSDVE